MILEHEKQDKDLNKGPSENLLLNLTEMYDIAMRESVREGGREAEGRR